MQPSFQLMVGQTRPAPSAPSRGGEAQPLNLAELLARVPGGILTVAGRDDEIAVQGDPADHCFLVLNGCVRVVTLLEDGRRQVNEFPLKDDVFGMEAMTEYTAAAEAVSDRVAVLRVPLRALRAMVHDNPEFARALISVTMSKLRAAQEHMVLLGRKTASERIATFLLEMAGRISADKNGHILLPMSRIDMADHLGLTIETVCRGLSLLRRAGAIAIERSSLEVRDAATLRAAAGHAIH